MTKFASDTQTEPSHLAAGMNVSVGLSGFVGLVLELKAIVMLVGEERERLGGKGNF